MTKTVIQFDHAALKAACRIMAKSDIRYYLNGVYIEATPTETVLAATDGHRLLVLRKEVPNDVRQVETLIIPGEVAQRIVAGSLKAVRQISLTQVDEGKWLVPLLKWDMEVAFRSVEGMFPNWRAVVPKATSGEAANIKPQYLADFEKAAQDMYGSLKHHSSSIEVRHNGPGGALVFPSAYSGQDFVGVVMPCVPDTNPRTTPPDWVLTEEPKLISARRALVARPVAKQNPQQAEAHA
ncbi:DNA polymerase III subunit beta [Achromobacter marplatensis]|uniref:Beta sliding clamp n=1 Tax=Achromobacter marplatensis TaxID=470868 RepID=A0AA43B2W6_9BURK|nr:DNA polymerase III subunit beta [Achromobacter marplatensis]MDH2053375.1 DNA polymerase III subunit beta [Achromobacter marplatensis]